jgi:hypothetical protein
MKTLAATYGYLRPDDQPQDWGADALVHHPDDISDRGVKAFNSTAECNTPSN